MRIVFSSALSIGYKSVEQMLDMFSWGLLCFESKKDIIIILLEYYYYYYSGCNRKEITKMWLTQKSRVAVKLLLQSENMGKTGFFRESFCLLATS